MVGTACALRLAMNRIKIAGVLTLVLAQVSPFWACNRGETCRSPKIPVVAWQFLCPTDGPIDAEIGHHGLLRWRPAVAKRPTDHGHLCVSLRPMQQVRNELPTASARGFSYGVQNVHALRDAQVDAR
jgi:hypothetical protein